MDLKNKVGPLTAVIMAVAVVVWMIIGGNGITTAMADSDNPPPVESNNTEPVQNDTKSVRVKVINAEPIQTTMSLAGETRASESLTLQASFSGTITRLNFDKGDNIKRRQAVIAMDTRVLQANIDRARAVIEEKKLDLAAAERLVNQKLSSKVSLATAKSALATAEADLQRLLIDLENSQTRAPFSGLLNDIHVNSGQVLQQGDPIAELITLQPLTIHAQVPQKDLSFVKVGSSATITTLTGFETQGEITFIDGVADAGTRSVGVDITIPNTDNALPAGISTTVEIDLSENMAHGFSPALLTLDDNGSTAVKTVDAQNTVAVTPVNILRFTREKVWVSGLPDNATIITRGQGFVNAGETVRIQTAQ